MENKGPLKVREELDRLSDMTTAITKLDRSLTTNNIKQNSNNEKSEENPIFALAASYID